MKRDTSSPNSKGTKSHATVYESIYSDLMSKGLVGFMAKVLHRNMEKPYRSGKKFDRVLEIGAGGSEHYPFVKHSFDEYWESDLRYEKSTASNFGVNNLTKTKKMFLDAQDLSGLEDNSFNRIIATCVLLHLRDIEGALIQWRRVVSDGGVITIYVPSEPGLLLSVAQYLTTRRKFEKQGVEYHSWQYQEHVSYFPRAKVLINKVFLEDKIVLKKFPVNFFPWHFTLWGVWQITVSKPNK